MGSIYEENKDEDGFLYIAYSGENTFGHLNWVFVLLNVLCRWIGVVYWKFCTWKMLNMNEK